MRAPASGFWTYNQGVLLGGLADLHAATGDLSLLQTGAAVARAAMRQLVTAGVLKERADLDISSSDHALFKGRKHRPPPAPAQH